MALPPARPLDRPGAWRGVHRLRREPGAGKAGQKLKARPSGLWRIPDTRNFQLPGLPDRLCTSSSMALSSVAQRANCRLALCSSELALGGGGGKAIPSNAARHRARSGAADDGVSTARARVSRAPAATAQSRRTPAAGAACRGSGAARRLSARASGAGCRWRGRRLPRGRPAGASDRPSCAGARQRRRCWPPRPRA